MTGERKRRNTTKTNSNNKVRRRVVRKNNTTKTNSKTQQNGIQQVVDQKHKKKMLRKERNRINARRFRERKKVYVETLEQETKTLKTENSSLTEKLNKVQQENLLLRKQIEQFRREKQSENVSKTTEEQTRLPKPKINQIESKKDLKEENEKEQVKEQDDLLSENEDFVYDLSSPIYNELYDPFPSSFQTDEIFELNFNENLKNNSQITDTQQNQFNHAVNEMNSSNQTKSTVYKTDLFGLQFFL
ncbi:transcription factor hy5-like [Anaeramoeba flamelloides]|uniref:Transcription factor hy5-like n=1 Tax=Anaeramoeba flamelloides TaxID=1746091 RepID=A0AAV7ZCA6_9EUKA|nr:transcription factor hy5-like [Anaeramoeba flamelloides]